MLSRGCFSFLLASLRSSPRDESESRPLLGSSSQSDPVTTQRYTQSPTMEPTTPSTSTPTPEEELTTLNERPRRPPLLPNVVVRSATEPFPNATRENRYNSSSNALTPSLSSQFSAASSRARSISSDSNNAELSLKSQLGDARSECQEPAHTFIIPRCRQEDLVTLPAVAQDLRARNRNINEADAQVLADRVCKCAKQLYATLAFVKSGAVEIHKLLDEEVYDKDLPLVRKMDSKRKYDLRRQNGQPIKTLEGWKDKDLEKFYRVQSWITAPVFKELDHLELGHGTILPFVLLKPHENNHKPKEGGYSKVYPVRISPSHHEFWPRSEREEGEPLVAVKQLFSSDEKEFRKEETILRDISAKDHPHLIKLLATFKLDDKYHLMFPFADANLRTYWEERPFPTFDEPTLLWSVLQMEGMAKALQVIHNFKVTIALKVPGPGEIRVPKDVKLSVRKGEELFGRHGDIKPENVLWFKKSRQTTNEMGVLQIADFGLGRFHGRDSRSKKEPYTVPASPTYEPPECKLRLPVSRAYDIWSLGCLYLEFITWLLKGNHQISVFSEARGRIDPTTSIDDDNFYTITRGTYDNDATVREAVVAWVEDLHAHEKCSQLIHDILNLVMKDMLIVNSKDRARAAWLVTQLRMYLKKAETDSVYLLSPVPHQRKPVNRRSSSTTSGFRERKSSSKRLSVSFADLRSGLPLPDVTPKGSLDLLLRNAGTPSLKPTLPKHHDTM